jgi:hypothetical protein
MQKLSIQALGQTIISNALDNRTQSQFDWRAQLFHKSGGIKKDWFIGQDNTSLEKIDFELTKKICGSGTIRFVYLDFPIDADDYVKIFFQNSLVYRAIVDQSIDPKGGKAKLLPYSQRFGELLANNTFTGKTIAEMLETIVINAFPDTQINFLLSLVDTGSIETFDKDFSKYETVKKIIDELVSELDDREWGVTADNLFTVYKPSILTDEILLYGDDPYYTDIKQDIDYSKIKATRYQVLKKNTTTDKIERIGEVGYGGLYPILSIENLTRKKEKKFTVSDLIVNNADALEFAYANLTSKAIVPQSITLKDFRFELLFPEIAKRYKVQDRIEYIRRKIIRCDSLTADDDSFEKDSGSWSGATLNTTDFTSGTASITYDGAIIGDSIRYDFGDTIKLLDPLSLGFMLKSEFAGDLLGIEIGIGGDTGGDGAWSSGPWSVGAWSQDNTSYTTDTILFEDTINIPNGQTWNYYEFPFTLTEFSYIKFKFTTTPSSTTTINIDDIGIFLPDRAEYESNVILAKFRLEKDDIKCDVKLNDYDLQANDDFFLLERELQKLEALSQDT